MSIPISVEGHEKVTAELDRLKKQRPEVIQAIAEAREEGDLKENAGYHAARERQGMIEARIAYIESRLPDFDIIDIKTMACEEVLFGATVEIEDCDTEEIKVYTLLGPDEADFANGSISILSPVAQALLGKTEGDVVEVKAPRGTIEYEILSIRYGD